MINLSWVKERLIVFLLILLIFLPSTFLSGGYTFDSLCLIESLVLLAGLIWSLGRIKLVKSSLTLPVLFYITTCLLSIINSYYLRGSWEEIIKLACGLIFFLMAGNYLSGRLKLLVYTFILTTLIVISFSLTQFFMHLPQSLASRLYYPLGNPNILGGFLAITIPLMLRILFVRTVRFRFLLGILLLFSMVTLWLTYSKGAGLGIIIAILFLSSINLFSIKRGKVSVWIMCLFVLFIIYITAGIWEHSFSERVYIWKHSWEMFLAHPILGTGLGTYPNVYFDYKGNTLWHFHAHNIFLQYGCEMGIIGLLSFTWLIIALFKIHFKNTADNYERAVREGLLASMVAFLTQAQVDYLLWIPVFYFYFWLILGVLSCKKIEGEYNLNFSRPIPLIIILFWVFCVLKPWLGYISFNQGVDLVDKGKWTEAKVKFESAVLLDFYHSVYHTHLGTVYTRIQPPDIESGCKECETAIQVDNYNRSAYYNLSQLYYQKGDFLKAQKALLRAIKLGRAPYESPILSKREEFFHQATSFYLKMSKLKEEKKTNTLSWILYRRLPMCGEEARK
ncbi:MAG: O-antigen ligase family protein [bacterium]|nr:O-antigen ligase family protein [bacterium]